LKLNRRKEKDVWILTFEGPLTAQEVPEFKKVLQPYLKEEPLKFVFDLRHVSFVDSTGLGALISFLRKIEPKGGKMVLANLNAEVQSIFEITRLHKLFRISLNLPEALESHGP